MNDNKRKVLLIGLDCAAPELIFDLWLDELPNIRSLIKGGVWGKMESSIPPITVPAWMCMMTGKDPGKLGIYGFRDRRDYSYDNLGFVSSRSVREETVWDILSHNDKKVVVIAVPPSYPPKAVNGYMVSCFLTPSIESGYTYPDDLKKEIESLVGNYQVDVEGFRSDDKDRLLAEIYSMTEKRFRVAQHLLKTKEWDFFMLMEIGVDRIHHGFWSHYDQGHRKHQPGSQYANAIKDYYKYIDREIGVLCSSVDDDTTIFIVSDHGAKRMDGGICVNEWLMREGYLTLKSSPSAIVPISKVEIDWEHTKVWGEGGYYGRIFLNVRGREPQGTIEPDDYERVRDELKDKLENLRDEKGNDIRTKAYKPEEIYTTCNGIPPDLIVHFGDLYWRSVGSVGHGSVYTYDNDTGPDDANHAQYGIYIQRDPRSDLGGEIEGINLLDVAPTILKVIDLPIPQDMKGKIIA